MTGTKLRALAATLLTVAALAAGPASASAQTAPQAACAPGASKFVPVSPVRVADTRYGTGLPTLTGGAEYTLDLSGYLPAGATAAVVNATVIDPSAPLYVTLWPAGTARAGTSTVNASRPLETIANLATVKISADRNLGVFASSTTHLALDLTGYYTASPSGSYEGRFTPIAPQRIYDTRERDGQLRNNRADFKLDDYGLYGASAVAVTLTVTNVTVPGYASIFPTFAVTGPPSTSTVNLTRGGQTVSNQAITEVNAGWFGVAVMGQADVVIDIVGVYTGPYTGSACSGLLVPIDPVRITDTREPSLTPYGSPRQSRFGETFPVNVNPISNQAQAIVGNLTAANITTPGYATVYDPHIGLTFVSSLYADTAGTMLASHIISASYGSGANRSAAVFTAIGADIIVDVTGYYID